MNSMRKKNKFKKERSFLNSDNSDPYNSGQINYKTLSKAGLEEFRQKLRKQKKKDSRKSLILVLVFVPLATFSIYFFYQNLYNSDDSDLQSPGKGISFSGNDQAMYLYYLKDGDIWLKNKDWKNAIYQYKKALELYPSDFNTEYRLSMAFVFQCIDKNQLCREAANLLDSLDNVYAGNPEIDELRAIYFNKKNRASIAQISNELLERLNSEEIFNEEEEQ